MAIAVGQDAPNFTLRDENGQDVSLAALCGAPVVLACSPFDFAYDMKNAMRDARDHSEVAQHIK